MIESDGNDLANGATEHIFFTGFTGFKGGVIAGNPIPGAPLSNLGMYSGVENEQRVFKKQGAYLITLKRTITTYTDDTRLLSSLNFYTIEADPGSYHNIPSGASIEDLVGINIGSYDLFTHWMHPSSVQTIQYDADGNNPVSQVTSYTYNNTTHKLVSIERDTSSAAEPLFTRYYYPQDTLSGLSPDAQAAQAELIVQHIINVPLIKEATRSAILVNKIVSNYFIWPSGLVLPANIEQQTGGYSLEQRVTFNNYDSAGNLLSVSLKDGPPIGYHWGYTGQLPVAECKNARDDEFFYEGFEESGDTTGSSHTGIRHNTGNYSLSFSLPNSREYVYSYFTLQSGKWVYSGKLPYTGAITITGTAIDDVRVCPKDAELTTFTYLPQAGTTSSLDAKGITTYYEYDTSQRLVTIKDQDGNVLKRIDYHYHN